MTTIDPRTVRTVSALRAALRESLVDRPLDDISVSELCRVAGVRRTTFYTHHASVGELLATMLLEDMDEPLALGDTSGNSVDQMIEEFQDALVAAFRVITRDRALFRAGFDSASAPLLRRSLEESFRVRVLASLDIWAEHGLALDVDRSVAVPFASAGLGGAVHAWAMSDDDDPVAWAEGLRDQMPPWWPRA